MSESLSADNLSRRQLIRIAFGAGLGLSVVGCSIENYDSPKVLTRAPELNTSTIPESTEHFDATTTTSSTTTSTSTSTSTTTTTALPRTFHAPFADIGSRVGDVLVADKILADVFQTDDPWQPEYPEADPVLTYIDNGPGLWGGNRLSNPGETDVEYPHAVLFGHRTTRLKDPSAKRILNMPQLGPFEHLDLVNLGDELQFRYLASADEVIGRFIYTCTEVIPQIESVGAAAENLIFPEISVPTLTLFACTPKGSTDFRIARRFELTDSHY